MISCSFSSVWVLFSSAPHSLLYHYIPERLSNEFLRINNFSNCYPICQCSSFSFPQPPTPGKRREPHNLGA